MYKMVTGAVLLQKDEADELRNVITAILDEYLDEGDLSDDRAAQLESLLKRLGEGNRT